MLPRRRSRTPRAVRRVAPALATLGVAASLAFAQAPTPAAGPTATVEVAASAGTADAPSPGAAVRVGVDGVRAGDAHLTLAAVAGARIDGARVGGDVAARTTRTLGPLGTGVLEGGVAVRSGVGPDAPPFAWAAAATARGNLGPVAGRFTVAHRGGPAHALEGAWAAGPTGTARGATLGTVPGTAPGSMGPAEAPLARGVRAGDDLTTVALHADARLPDGVVLAVGGAREVGTAGRAWAGDVGVRLRRAVRRDVDLRVAWQGRWEPPTAGADPLRATGIGVGVTQRPRRAPERTLRAWLDVAQDGGPRLTPGVDAAWAGDVAAGRASVRLQARPGGPLPTPWRATVAWRTERGAATWTVWADLAAAADAATVRLAVARAAPWSTFGRAMPR